MTLPPVPAQKESDTVVRVKLADLAKMSPEDREHVIAAIVAVAKLPRDPDNDTTQVMSPEGVVSVVRSVYRQQGGL